MKVVLIPGTLSINAEYLSSNWEVARTHKRRVKQDAMTVRNMLPLTRQSLTQQVHSTNDM